MGTDNLRMVIFGLGAIVVIGAIAIVVLLMN